MLLAVPNFSEGRDAAAIEAIAAAFESGTVPLDRHCDPAHNRTVLSLALTGSDPAAALLAGARACRDAIDMRAHEGAHPCIGALDVCPVVWPELGERARARELALAVAAGIGELGIPAFLYGELASEPGRVERAFFRSGGLAALARRMAGGELAADFGPPAPHPSAGATLVTARAPLAAFNLLLDGGDPELARAIAAELREAGGGLPGVRAIGVDLKGRAQVSTNVHDPVAVPLAEVVARVRALAAARGATVLEGEVVGLVSEAAIRGLPEDLALAGFDPERQLIERRLAELRAAGGS